jgi:dipeptidyl aminopeptidase/acylaminoacyl peptidase
MTDRFMDADGTEFDGVAPSLLDAEDAPGELARRRATRWAGWFADGAMLVRARAGRAAQLFRVAAPGAPLTALTHHERSVRAAAASPDGTLVAFVLERLEGARLFLLRLADRSVERVGGDAVDCTDPVWSRDGGRLVFRGRPAPGADEAILVVEPGTSQQARPLLGGRAADGRPRGLRPLGWSADDRSLLVAANGDSPALLSVDTTSGVTTPLLPELKLDGEARFAPGGRALYALARKPVADGSDGEPLRRLHYIDLASGGTRTLAPTLPWDVERFALSADGRQVAISALAAGFNVLRVLDQASGAVLEPPGLVAGFIDEIGFDRDGDRLALTLETADSPADAWSWDLRSQVTTRWTAAPLDRDAAALAIPRRVQLPGWDAAGAGRRGLPGWLMLPVAARGTTARRPVWLAPRLGTATRTHPRFDTLTQHVVNGLDYVALAPDLPAGAGREAMIRDLGAVLVWIGLQRDLDSSRIVLVATDDAAELLLPALAQYGDRLRAGIQLRGAPQTTRGPRGALLASPVLIVHGRDDPRWAGSWGGRATAGVRSLGNEAWRVALPAEGGDRWVRPENEERCAQAVAAFLRRFNAPRGG